MQNANDPRLCYMEDVDDPLRSFYCDPEDRVIEVEAAAEFERILHADWAEKLGSLKKFFKSHRMTYDADAVYDIRYRGSPNQNHLYDVLFMPTMNRPALKLSLSVRPTELIKLDWRIYLAKPFSAIDPGLYTARYRILADDLPACRESYIEIMKDRLTPAGFEAWLKKASFA
jgi:hypothetical protein